ncbi:MAG: nucleotidyltransferase family protein [Clostridia bacterium]
MKIGCILLAAGFGKRFGGDKLMHIVNGQTMVAHACTLHSSLPYDARILVSHPGDLAVQDCATTHGFFVVINERAPEGIGTSASRGIAALCTLPDHFDGALFGVCDQPYLTVETVRRLLAAFALHPDRILALEQDGRRGNPVIFPHSMFAELSKLDGEHGGSTVVRLHPELLMTISVVTARELTDIDTKEGNPK